MRIWCRWPWWWAALILLWCLRTAAADTVGDGEEPWINPWCNSDGSLKEGCILIRSDQAYASLAAETSSDIPSLPVTGVGLDDFPVVDGEGVDFMGDGPSGRDEFDIYETMNNRIVRVAPRDEFNRLGGAGTRGATDRGIDTADTKWRRQARLTGVRMRMLNGPEAALSIDGLSSNTEKGFRSYQGAVVPLNPRWELAVLNKLARFEMKEGGGTAGLDAVTIRVGANPSVSFRPWIAVTPYVGFDEADNIGLGITGGVSKAWSSGMYLEGQAYAFEPWEEGYETIVQDGRSHGFRIQGTMPVDRRLTITAMADYEWLELGPHARDGACYAGRRGSGTLRAEWLALKRDGAFMGYGFRDQTLWSEQLVPTELGFFVDVHWQRYFQPRDFEVLNPTRKSWRQRVGILYNQAFSPHIGVNVEAFIGQDVSRHIDPGKLYGATVRLNVVINPHFRAWAGWGYESNADTLQGGGGPDRTFSAGLHCNF